MRPGTTHLPRMSTTRTPCPAPCAIPGPTLLTAPSFKSTSASASKPRRGSMTRPPRRQRSIRRVPLIGGSPASVNRFRLFGDERLQLLEPAQLVLESRKAGVEAAGIRDHEDA